MTCAPCARPHSLGGGADRLRTALGWCLAWAIGWNAWQGVVFGLALSVASTVVLMRALEDHSLDETARGKTAIGWLIVEDLVMILALVLLRCWRFHRAVAKPRSTCRSCSMRLG